MHEMNRDEINRPDVAEATLQGPHGTIAVPAVQNRRVFPDRKRYFRRNYLPEHSIRVRRQNHSRYWSQCGRCVSLSCDELSRGTGICLRARKRCLVAVAKNVEQLRQRQRVSFRSLLAGQDAVACFTARMTAWSRRSAPARVPDHESEQIRLKCASQFLSEHGIENVDILKIDTEGCEVPILQSLEQVFARGEGVVRGISQRARPPDD